MTTIAATNSPASNDIVSLLRSGSIAGADAPGKTSVTSPSSGNPVDTVDLSDRAQAVLARAKVDKVAADRLAAQVQAAKENDKSGHSSTASDPSKLSQTTRYAQWAATLTSPSTVRDAPAPYGDPTTSDAQFIKDNAINETLLGTADTYDKQGLPPEVGQAIRTAVANGTLKIQQASDVPNLNMHSVNIYTPSSIGGPSEWGSVSQNPTGATKQALDQGKALAMWTADRGNIYITW